MAGGGSTQPQQVTTNTSNLPDYAQPFFTNILQRAQAQSNAPYTPYTDQRIAGFTQDQQTAQQGVMGLQNPSQFQEGSQLAGNAGLGALSAGQYTPGQFSAQQIGLPNLTNYQMSAAQTGYNPSLTNYQMNGVADVNTSGMQAPGAQMTSAQSTYNPALNYFQMNTPDTFGQQQANQYMSPYIQNVVDVQKQQAIRDAQKDQLVNNLGAVRSGSYGGARQLLAGTERERALSQNLGNIQATGLQNAYENAQQQFERDRTAGMTAGAQNLNANLQTQALGVNAGLQTSLANLSADQQGRVQNLAAQLQTQGLNADQALRAALANQQSALTTGQQNLGANLATQQLGVNTGLQTALANLANQQGANQQNLSSSLATQQLGTQSGLQALLANQSANLQAQQAGEQSRQFGAANQLQGLAQANQSAQTLGNLGQLQQQGDLSRLNAQSAVGQQQQALQQQQLDQQYADFLRQRDYPMEQLGYYSNLLHGIPVGLNSTSTTYGQSPSLASQVGGLGLGALGLAQMAQ